MGKTEYLQGALDLLSLKTLALGPNPGWGIQQRINQVSREALTVSQGSLYPALHRLEAAGMVASEMTLSEAEENSAHFAPALRSSG
ncbi:MAG: helix-turn-helix transcriptional regulator, partial [Vicinamibacterales bacterium]